MNDDSVHLCINGVTWQHQLLWCDHGMMCHMPLAVTACCTDYNPSCVIQSGSVLRYCLANSSTLAQSRQGRDKSCSLTRIKLEYPRSASLILTVVQSCCLSCMRFDVLQPPHKLTNKICIGEHANLQNNLACFTDSISQADPKQSTHLLTKAPMSVHDLCLTCSAVCMG